MVASAQTDLNGSDSMQMCAVSAEYVNQTIFIGDEDIVFCSVNSYDCEIFVRINLCCG